MAAIALIAALALGIIISDHNSKINQLQKSNLDTRLTTVENRIDNLNNTLIILRGNYTHLNKNITDARHDLDDVISDVRGIRANFTTLGIDVLENRISVLENRTDEIDATVSLIMSYIETLMDEVFPDAFVITTVEPEITVGINEIHTVEHIVTYTGDTDLRVENLTLSAFINGTWYNEPHIVFAPYGFDPKIATYKVYNNIDEIIAEGTVTGYIEYFRFASFPWQSSPPNPGIPALYCSVTWRLDGYLEGNDGDPETNTARIEFSFDIQGYTQGGTVLYLFTRATEDFKYIGVESIDDISDQTNLILVNGRWYPAPSYDPFDWDITDGHTFEWPYSWQRKRTMNEYSKSVVMFTTIEP